MGEHSWARAAGRNRGRDLQLPVPGRLLYLANNFEELPALWPYADVRAVAAAADAGRAPRDRARSARTQTRRAAAVSTTRRSVRCRTTRELALPANLTPVF
jgi:hypothetical protein